MGKRGAPKKQGLEPWEIDRAKRMLSAYVDDDMTLRQIGQYHGVTGERVRQILKKYDDTTYRVALMRRKHRVVRARHIRIWKKVGSIKKVCPICGETFFQGHRLQVYCSEQHRKVWILLRYQIDDEHREKMQISIARWNLKNGDMRQQNYAIKKLSGSVDEDYHRTGLRYMVPGSLSFHWAVRAYALGWPMFDQLHPDVQKQIKEFVG